MEREGGEIMKRASLGKPVCAFSPADAGSPVSKTGQTNPVWTGDDAYWQKGARCPGPRFTVRTNGTDQVVTDALTGLIWVRAPHALPGNAGQTNWTSAMDFCNSLTYEGQDDWRLPNLREMHSLIDYSVFGDVMLPSGHPFIGIWYGMYWTSTDYLDSPFFYAFAVATNVGEVKTFTETVKLFVWPVRGGP